jgi:hypothetical protein
VARSLHLAFAAARVEPVVVREATAALPHPKKRPIKDAVATSDELDHDVTPPKQRHRG